MRHIPFFEAIADVADTEQAAEKSGLLAELHAAIIILRLFDDWVDNPGTVLGIEDPRRKREMTVNEVQDMGIQHLFKKMLHMLDEWKGHHPTRVVGPMIAYAWLLEERELYQLAEDVMTTVADAVQPVSGPVHHPRAIEVQRKLGQLAM